MLDQWLARFVFSRTLRHAPRDFSDAVLMAELLSQLLPPGAVGLHNYPSTGRYQQKLVNWDILNRKVLTSIGCELSRHQIEQLAGAAPNAISILLVRVKQETDKNTPTPPMGKPPRSPTRKSSTGMTIHEALTLRSKGATRNGVKMMSSYKLSDQGSPFATTRSTTSRSVPSSPQKDSNTRCSSPPSSPYTLMDYLPLTSERPTPESVTGTLKSACHLQMQSKRQANLASDRRSGRSHSVSSLSENRPCEVANIQQPLNNSAKLSSFWTGSPLDTSNDKPISLRVDTQGRGMFPVPVDHPCASDIPEGSFALLNPLAGDVSEHSEAPQLVRVARSLSFDEYLVQLLKPLHTNLPLKSTADIPVAPNSDALVSTPHFIQSYRSQLQPVSGYGFDPIANVWIAERPHVRTRAWSAGPTFARPSSPLRDYTTTVLSRHKFSPVGLQSPVELCSVELVTSALRVVASPSDTSVTPSVQDLCLEPTVFPPVQLDVTALLDSPPPRFAASPKKKCQPTQSIL